MLSWAEKAKKTSPNFCSVAVLDGKNNAHRFHCDLQKSGVDSTIFVSSKSGGLNKNPATKGDDFSQIHRDAEIDAILRQHQIKPFDALVIVNSEFLSMNDVVNVTKRIKSQAAEIAILGVGIRERQREEVIASGGFLDCTTRDFNVEQSLKWLGTLGAGKNKGLSHGGT